MTLEQELAATVEKHRAHNDEMARSQRERPSVPPSAPRSAAPITITVERARDIAKALKSSHPMLTAAAFLSVDGERVTPAEFMAFVDLCARGAK